MIAASSLAASAARARRLVPREQLRRVSRRSDGRGLRQLVGHLGLLTLTGLLVHAARGSPWLVPAIVLHGLVLVHLFAALHEATHGTAFASPWLNRSVSWLTGLLLLMPPTQFRLEHAAHHAHTQDEARDPQLIAASARRASYILFATGLPFWMFLAGNLVRHGLGRFNAIDALSVAPGMRGAVTREARIFWLAYALAALGSWLLGSTALLLYWILPRLAGEPWMRLVRMAEHGACPKVADMLRNTRTVRTLAPLRWLAWNMPFHAEHHALPAVPFHALPALHRLLAAHIAELEPGYLAAHRRILAAQRGSSS